MSADGTSRDEVPAGIRVFPNVWPAIELPAQPGDVRQFVPQGYCFGGPVVMRPWDTLESAMSAGGYYGAQAQRFHPLLGAPATEPCGGTIYFDSSEETETLITTFELMGARLRGDERNYAVFVSVTSDAQADGFLTHCRVIPYGTLNALFGIPDGFEAIEGKAAPQPMTMADFLRGFVELQRGRYGTSMCPELYGAMGGDGDWAKEALCFGFMMENPYHQVMRIWTRAWLVTK